jgi:hypothetical protein
MARAGDGGATSSRFTIDRGASLVAGSRRGVLQRRRRVPTVLDKALTGLGKWLAGAAAMGLELRPCDGEKRPRRRSSGSFIGARVQVHVDQ